MAEKNILIHVKSDEALNNYMTIYKNGNYDDNIMYSKEIKAMLTEFLNNGWNCFLTTRENFDMENEIFHKVYCIKEDKLYDMSIKEVNEKIPVMIIRNIGPLELNFNKIKRYLDYICENYKGKVLNNPKAMLKGMAKNYLVEISEELRKINIITIPTKAYPTTVTYPEIQKDYPENREKYLIKPISGELSNSLQDLDNIDEDFLRRKENKVQGWLIQPIQEAIWNGEYQLVFLNGKVIYGQQKSYVKDGDVPSQKGRKLNKYHPNSQEIETMQKLIKYFEDFYDIKVDICRIDFMKNEEGLPILLEFEMVNPGFFIAYMDENDSDVKNIVKSIREYCEKFIMSGQIY